MTKAQKVTVTLRAEQLAEIRDLVDRGQAPNVAEFVQHAIKLALAEDAAWGSMIAQALLENGGPITPEERAWAQAVLNGVVPEQAP
ncbi:ribbon-helix-helix domain-containing protein [Sporichthya sp.]|uniref:ribbon-helix-helix domain-containing protein n=1 Tax=Sporichthya sp. TaxID=65475 RepID=UPI0017E3711C|nr:ribbon-helix-helix domain-containing protein [Sporichthya sp.]MBA3741878.1 hypothetical protein [Sporichthya sp.]